MGLDSSIEAKIKFKNGFEITKEICYWRKHWALRNRIMREVIIDEDPDGGSYKINKGDLIDIRDILESICKDYKNIPEYDYWDNSNKFITANYCHIGMIQSLIILINDNSFIYDYLSEDEYDDAADDKGNIIVDSIEVYYIDSY